MIVQKNALINICLVILSSMVSIAIGYSALKYFTRVPEDTVYRGRNNEYLLAFYNRKGEKISEINGALHLLIDPFTIYVNYPNQRSLSYSINKYGFRDGYASDKPYIAMVIGGSAAFGFALDDSEKTFVSKVSRNSQKYNVINSAVVGFLSGQELSQMVHYLDDFNPSLYIVFDGWNDIYDPYSFTKSWPAVHPPIGYNNAFFMIEDRLSAYFQMTRKEKDSHVVTLYPASEPLDENMYFQKIVDTYISNISKMHSFAKARGAEFLLIFQPELGNKKVHSPGEQDILKTWVGKYEYGDRKITERYKALINEGKKFFEAKNISFIDINAEPGFSENPQTLFYDVVHPNELGHDIIAKIINQLLVKRF